MKKAIPIGVSDYERLRKEDYYFVDKSMMIQEFLRRKSIVTLITRPRRFGKTINMSMMAEFFDVTKDAKEIFKDTAIMDTEYAAEMNQYPTIFLSFANICQCKRKQAIGHPKHPASLSGTVSKTPAGVCSSG